VVADFGDGLAPARDVDPGDGLEILGVDVETVCIERVDCGEVADWGFVLLRRCR
jgi:hypothetical protein